MHCSRHPPCDGTDLVPLLDQPTCVHDVSPRFGPQQQFLFCHWSIPAVHKPQRYIYTLKRKMQN